MWLSEGLNLYKWEGWTLATGTKLPKVWHQLPCWQSAKACHLRCWQDTSQFSCEDELKLIRVDSWAFIYDKLYQPQSVLILFWLRHFEPKVCLCLRSEIQRCPSLGRSPEPRADKTNSTRNGPSSHRTNVFFSQQSCCTLGPKKHSLDAKYKEPKRLDYDSNYVSIDSQPCNGRKSISFAETQLDL